MLFTYYLNGTKLIFEYLALQEMVSYANGVFWRHCRKILKTSSDSGMRLEYAIQNPEAAGLFRESCNVFSDAKSSIEQIIRSSIQ